MHTKNPTTETNAEIELQFLFRYFKNVKDSCIMILYSVLNLLARFRQVSIGEGTKPEFFPEKSGQRITE